MCIGLLFFWIAAFFNSIDANSFTIAAASTGSILVIAAGVTGIAESV